jgi:hypothetical protein
MNIPVILNKKSTRQVIVKLKEGLGSFAENRHYDISTTTFVFEPGKIKKALTVKVNKDQITSPTRLVLAIDSVQGAGLGTILDLVIWMYSPTDDTHQNVKP